LVSALDFIDIGVAQKLGKNIGKGFLLRVGKRKAHWRDIF
jgi:hypothetical protein